MTVEELYNKLKYEIEAGRGDNVVHIIASNSSMGPRASSELKYANVGFDWEHGRFNLVSKEQLFLHHFNISETIKLKNLNNPQNPE